MWAARRAPLGTTNSPAVSQLQVGLVAVFSRVAKMRPGPRAVLCLASALLLVSALPRALQPDASGGPVHTQIAADTDRLPHRRLQEERKPMAILHVGPHKMGSTSVQAALATFHDQLTLDGFIVPSISDGYQRLYAAASYLRCPNGTVEPCPHMTCPLKCDDPEVERGWADLEAVLHTARREGKGVILSAEDFDRPDVRVKELFDALHGFNVTTVVMYRHYFDWIASVYGHLRGHEFYALECAVSNGMNCDGALRWEEPRTNTLKDAARRYTPLVKWLTKDLLTSYLEIYTPDVLRRFANFGAVDIIMMDERVEGTPEGTLEQALLCRGWSPNACSAAQANSVFVDANGGRRFWRKKGDALVLQNEADSDHTLALELAVVASNEGLLPADGNAQEAVNLLASYMEEHGTGFVPRHCLASRHGELLTVADRLWDITNTTTHRTLFLAEKLIGHTPVGLSMPEVIKAYTNSSATKLCSVDANGVRESKDVREVLGSLFPEAQSAQPEAQSAQPEAQSAQPEAQRAQPDLQPAGGPTLSGEDSDASEPVHTQIDASVTLPHLIIQYGESRTASTLQFQTLCAFAMVLNEAEPGRVNCSFLPSYGTSGDLVDKAADQSTLHVVKTHVVPAEGFPKDAWLFVSEIDDAVGSDDPWQGAAQQMSAELKHEVKYVQVLSRLMTQGSGIATEYKPLFGLSDQQVEQVVTYLRYWDILRMCCGAQMSDDWRAQLIGDAKPATSEGSYLMTAKPENCQLHDIPAIERHTVRTQVFQLAAKGGEGTAYLRSTSSLERDAGYELDGGYCDWFNKEVACQQLSFNKLPESPGCSGVQPPTELATAEPKVEKASPCGAWCTVDGVDGSELVINCDWDGCSDCMGCAENFVADAEPAESDGSHEEVATQVGEDAAGGRESKQELEDGMCPKPEDWCVHAGATNEPKKCDDIPGHFCHDTEGESGFHACDQKAHPTTWGTVYCVEAACACSSTCNRDVELRSASGHCGQAVSEGDACTHERLFASSQPGVGIVVLERNEVYRVDDMVYCSSSSRGCFRARLDARTIICEKMYRGTLLRKMLAEITNNGTVACDDGCEDKTAAIAEPHPGFSYGSFRDAWQKKSDLEKTSVFLEMGGAKPRLDALSRLVAATRGECTLAADDELVVPLRMGDVLPSSPEAVVQSVRDALAQASMKSVRSIVFNAVMHYGNNEIRGQFVRTAETDRTNLQFVDTLSSLWGGGDIPIAFRSEPSVDADLCYLVHSPHVMIAAKEDYDTQERTGGSFPMLVSELRSRAGGAQQHTLFTRSPWQMVSVHPSHPAKSVPMAPSAALSSTSRSR